MRLGTVDGQHAWSVPFGVPFGWFEICPSNELPVGTVFPLFLGGRHLVLWRDVKGRAHLNDAFCPHQGAHIGYMGTVEGERIQCPYHGWQFDETGRGCPPRSDGQTNSSATLKAHEVFEGRGVVYAWLHPNDEPPSWQMDEVPLPFGVRRSWTGAAASKVLRSRLVFAPWQEIAENQVDALHVSVLHANDLVPLMETLTAEGPVLRGQMGLIDVGQGLSEGKPTYVSYGPGVVHLVLLDSKEIYLELLISLTPVDVDKTVITLRFAASVGEPLDGDFIVEQMAAETVRQINQDIVVWNHKIYRPDPPLGPKERRFISLYRSWAAQFYADGVLDAEGWQAKPHAALGRQADFEWSEQSVFRSSEVAADRFAPGGRGGALGASAEGPV